MVSTPKWDSTRLLSLDCGFTKVRLIVPDSCQGDVTVEPINRTEEWLLARLSSGHLPDARWHPMPITTDDFVRGEFVACLLTHSFEFKDNRLDSVIRLAGVRMRGILINGDIILSDMLGFDERGLSALDLEGCKIDGELSLSGASISRVSLKGTSLRKVWAQDCRVAGQCDLRQIAPFDQTLVVQLSGATVAGDVLIGGSTLTAGVGTSPFALAMRSTKVRGSVVASPSGSLSTTILGKVSLDDAEIDSYVDWSGAKIAAPQRGIAITANGVQIGDDWRMNRGTVIDGSISLRNSRIGQHFVVDDSRICSRASQERKAPPTIDLANSELGRIEVRNSLIEGEGLCFAESTVASSVRIVGSRIEANDRDAIAAISANVAGNFHLLDSTLLTSGSSRAIEARSIQIGKTLRASNTSITGLTFLANAAIRGSLLLEEKSSLSVHQGIAVFGENLSVAEDLQFFDLEIQGSLHFDRVSVGKETKWKRLRLTSAQTAENTHRRCWLRFSNANLGLVLNTTDVSVRDGDEMTIDLTGARVEALEDDPNTGWGGRKTQLLLDGFSYHHILVDQQEADRKTSKARIAWLARQYVQSSGRAARFRPHPHHQLARVLYGMGSDQDAREIVMDRAKTARRLQMRDPFSKFGSLIFEVCFGYGLSNMRATITAIMFLVVASIAYSHAHAGGYLQPVDASSELGRELCGPMFNAPIYAVDTSLPLIDLQAGKECIIRTPRSPTYRDIVLSPPIAFRAFERDWSLRAGLIHLSRTAMWQWGKSILDMLGWIILSLCVVTYAGFIRRYNYHAAQA